MVALTACDKGGSDFSVKSTTNNYQQALTFVPRKLDVLFVVDNSGSMATSQQNLANNFPSFINHFVTKGYDFRLAVTTTDAYLLGGREKFKSGTNPKIYVIDPTTPDLATVFAANAKVGTTGSGTERAFKSFQEALNSPLNAGFHRSDAYLAIVIISDEDDTSSDSIPGYKTYLEGFTGGTAPTDFSVSSITVTDSACANQVSTYIGTRHINLANLTGGTVGSICSPFNTVLDSISANIASQTQAIFNLGKKAVVSTIRVWVNGIIVPQNASNGWTYDAVNYTITIKGTYAPAAGDQIMIDFDPDYAP